MIQTQVLMRVLQALLSTEPSAQLPSLSQHSKDGEAFTKLSNHLTT